MELRAYLNTLDCSNRPHKNEQVWLNTSNVHRLTTLKTLKSVASGEYDEFNSDLVPLLESEVRDYDIDYSRLCSEDLIIIKVKLK